MIYILQEHIFLHLTQVGKNVTPTRIFWHWTRYLYLTAHRERQYITQKPCMGPLP